MACRRRAGAAAVVLLTVATRALVYGWRSESARRCREEEVALERAEPMVSWFPLRHEPKRRSIGQQAQ